MPLPLALPVVRAWLKTGRGQMRHRRVGRRHTPHGRPTFIKSSANGPQRGRGQMGTARHDGM